TCEFVWNARNLDLQKNRETTITIGVYAEAPEGAAAASPGGERCSAGYNTPGTDEMVFQLETFIKFAEPISPPPPSPPPPNSTLNDMIIAPPPPPETDSYRVNTQQDEESTAEANSALDAVILGVAVGASMLVVCMAYYAVRATRLWKKTGRQWKEERRKSVKLTDMMRVPGNDDGSDVEEGDSKSRRGADWETNNPSYKKAKNRAKESSGMSLREKAKSKETGKDKKGDDGDEKGDGTDSKSVDSFMANLDKMAAQYRKALNPEEAAAEEKRKKYGVSPQVSHLESISRKYEELYKAKAALAKGGGADEDEHDSDDAEEAALRAKFKGISDDPEKTRDSTDEEPDERARSTCRRARSAWRRAHGL
ncbi:hypothetical protein CYMTET_32022, partial [Cymbomonas tetramitiformis]